MKRTPKVQSEVRAVTTQKKPRPDQWDDFWYSQPLLSQSAAGVPINEITAMNYSAVFTCVRILSETISSLPLFVYQRVGEGREKAPDHPLYKILHDTPNPEMSSMQFREVQMLHLCLWGNSYSEIATDKAGNIIALWPLNPPKMTVKRNEANQLVYEYILPTGGKALLRKDQVLHIAGMGWNGLMGQSPISFAAQAIGLGVATEEFGSRFFSGDGSPSGVLEHPGHLGPEGKKGLVESYRLAHGGLSNTHRLLVLEEGLKFNKIGIPANDAQWLESRYFQLEEVCRIYRIPAHLAGDLRRATFSNIEEMGINFVVHTIRPWCVRIEQAIQLRLLKEEEQGLFYAEHLVDGLLRGNITSRYGAYAIGKNGGWLSANEIRQFENMNPIDGGDEYQQTPTGAAPNKEAPPEEEKK